MEKIPFSCKYDENFKLFLFYSVDGEDLIIEIEDLFSSIVGWNIEQTEE